MRVPREAFVIDGERDAGELEIERVRNPTELLGASSG
jgi:hypothetical protein